MARPATLVEQATARELAALVDGPWAPCWYWRTDLEAQQAAARSVHERGGTAVLGDKAHYQPTDWWVDHPHRGGRARARLDLPARDRREHAMTEQHEPTVPQPRQPVVWGCTEHRTPAGQECHGCADQGELFTRADSGARTYGRTR